MVQIDVDPCDGSRKLGLDGFLPSPFSATAARGSVLDPMPGSWAMAGWSTNTRLPSCWIHRIEDLEGRDNPAALLVLAHHYTMGSKNRQLSRRQYQLHLVRLLFRKGYDQEQSGKIFKLLDRMMRLDREQAIIFSKEVTSLREEPEMSAYVHTLESVFREQGIAEGKQTGKQQMLRAQLVRRFGEIPAWAISRLSDASIELLDRWSLRLLDAARLEDVFA